jgi:hypothetical protein
MCLVHSGTIPSKYDIIQLPACPKLIPDLGCWLFLCWIHRRSSCARIFYLSDKIYASKVCNCNLKKKNLFPITLNSHRHIRFALFFHSLAMIACVRKGNLTEECRSGYLAQIQDNQAYIRKWVLSSPYFQCYSVTF